MPYSRKTVDPIDLAGKAIPVDLAGKALPVDLAGKALPIDWVYGAGFEGRAVRPRYRTGSPSGPTPPAIDGVIQTEAGDYLQTEASDYLAFN